MSRDRCNDDYYTLQPSSIPITGHIQSPLPQQQSNVQPGKSQSGQSQTPPESSRIPWLSTFSRFSSLLASILTMCCFFPFCFVAVAPSVLYTVQRVITTSQIQSTELLECSSGPASNVHIATASNSTCSNTYQAQAQMMTHMTDGGAQSASANFYATPAQNAMPPADSSSINRPLQSVSCSFRHILHRFAPIRPLPSISHASICLPFQVIPMCVYLMSRVAVHMEIEGTAQCMLINFPISRLRNKTCDSPLPFRPFQVRLK